MPLAREVMPQEPLLTRPKNLPLRFSGTVYWKYTPTLMFNAEEKTPMAVSKIIQYTTQNLVESKELPIIRGREKTSNRELIPISEIKRTFLFLVKFILGLKRAPR